MRVDSMSSTMRSVTVLLVALTLGITAADDAGDVTLNGVEPGKPRPKHCCLPLKYEGRMAIQTDTGMPSGGMVSIGAFVPRFAVDYDKNIVAVDEIVETKVGKQFITTIFNLKTRVGYIIYPKSKKCTRIETPTYMNTTRCIPKDAEHHGPTRLGGGRNGLRCDAWKISKNSSAPSYDIQVMLTLQSDDCMPVLENINVNVNGTTTSSFMIYMDMKMGIRNPKIFDIPDYCKAAESGDIDMLSGTARHAVNSK